MVTDLSGKVAIVTGASRGIGRAYTQALAAAGATVVATARSFGGDPSQSLTGVAAPASGSRGAIVAHGCDLGDEDDIARLVAQTAANFGRVDVLVNNAAMYPHYETLKATRADWAENLSLNLLAPYFTIREAVPVMAAGGGGSIVNLTSLAAQRTDPVAHQTAHEGLLVYGVTKAALNRLTSYFADDLRPLGIAVNAMSPGGVLTETWRQVDPEAWENARTRSLAFEPLPEVVGPPVVALAAKRPDTMTGQFLHAAKYGTEWS